MSSKPLPKDPEFIANDLVEPGGCPGEPLIEMLQIVKTFKTQAGDFRALNGITTCFYPGEFVSVVGKSGSGKSTLVNMITGIDHPTSGSVRIGKTDIHKMSESDMSVWRGRNLGVVFQFFQLLPMLSILENVLLPMDFCDKYAPAEREGHAMALLEMVGLAEFAHKMPATISGGQQQSAAIARALANDPPIIIADEPTGNLDSRTADSVFEIFHSLVGQGKTILMVTHDISLARRTDRVLLLSDGELINPWVSQVFPQLSHRRMLWLTRQLSFQSLEPGEIIPINGQSGNGLWLVTGGQLQVLLDGARNGHHAPANMKAGEMFSRFGIQTSASLIRGFQVAGNSPAEILSLSRDDFEHWMEEAPSDQANLQKAAQEQTAAWGYTAENTGSRLVL
jgi:putative ABC transport system ATP-binding protein